jgi:hypothetical protein
MRGTQNGLLVEVLGRGSTETVVVIDMKPVLGI